MIASRRSEQRLFRNNAGNKMKILRPMAKSSPILIISTPHAQKQENVDADAVRSSNDSRNDSSNGYVNGITATEVPDSRDDVLEVRSKLTLS